MKSDFNDLSAVDINILEYILHTPGCKAGDIPIGTENAADFHVERLLQEDFIEGPEIFGLSDLTITEKGKAAILEYSERILDNEDSSAADKTDALHKIADTLLEQNRILEQSVLTASREARTARVIAVFGVLVALASFIWSTRESWTLLLLPVLQ
jgi:hypothetical protein